MSKKVIDLLNDARSRELSAITQYMAQHYELEDQDFGKLAKKLKEIGIQEMKHAEALAERIDLLGGVPTTQPKAIKVGGNLKKMLQDDLAGENIAIALYTQHVALADKEKDVVTRRLLESILGDEQGHANDLETVLAK